MPHYRCFIDGSLSAGDEVWSTGFAITDTDAVPDQAGISAAAQAMFDYLEGEPAEVQQFLAFLGLVNDITRVRLYHYPAVNLPADLLGEGSGEPISGTGTALHPPQCSTVFTLLTGIPGRSGRGRMYWPCIAPSLGSSSRLTSANVSMAENFGLMLSNLAALTPGTLGGEPALVSVVQGTVTPVTAISVGNVVDTQRRRRDALVETRFTAPI